MPIPLPSPAAYTGYQKIVEAVIAAARQLNSWPEDVRRAL